MLCLLERLPGFGNLKSEIANLKDRVEVISRQLRGWAQALQDSKITGQRYLTQKVRIAKRKSDEREEFLLKLRHIQEQNRGKPSSQTGDRGA